MNNTEKDTEKKKAMGGKGDVYWRKGEPREREGEGGKEEGEECWER